MPAEKQESLPKISLHAKQRYEVDGFGIFVAVEVNLKNNPSGVLMKLSLVSEDLYQNAIENENKMKLHENEVFNNVSGMLRSFKRKIEGDEPGDFRGED